MSWRHHEDPRRVSDEDLVIGLTNVAGGLTEWEVEFAESIARQVLDEKRELTDRQRAKAEELYDEHV